MASCQKAVLFLTAAALLGCSTPIEADLEAPSSAATRPASSEVESTTVIDALRLRAQQPPRDSLPLDPVPPMSHDYRVRQLARWTLRIECARGSLEIDATSGGGVLQMSEIREDGKVGGGPEMGEINGRLSGLSFEGLAVFCQVRGPHEFQVVATRNTPAGPERVLVTAEWESAKLANIQVRSFQ